MFISGSRISQTGGGRGGGWVGAAETPEFGTNIYYLNKLDLEGGGGGGAVPSVSHVATNVRGHRHEINATPSGDNLSEFLF